jgi:hypothetical protein
MQSAESNGFVADGHERAREGIRAQVEAEYAERLKTASAEENSRLRREMLREFDSRVQRSTRPDALY